ncbi:MAG: AraC family ligand binding domain-containing protein, partial [Chitinophagales bacterium]
MKNIKHVEFSNSTNSNAKFDFVKLETLFQKKNMDHSVEKPHKVGFFVIILIEEGNGHHNIDFIDYQCSKGTLLTIRKDQIHKFSKNDSLTGSLLVFTNDFLANYLEQIEAQKSLLLFNESLENPKIQLNDSEFNDVKKLVFHIEKEYFGINDGFQMGIIRSALHILDLLLIKSFCLFCVIKL